MLEHQRTWSRFVLISQNIFASNNLKPNLCYARNYKKLEINVLLKVFFRCLFS